MAEATGLQRDYRWEINMGTASVPVWTTVPGLQGFTPTIEPTDQEDNDYESGGWGGFTRTMLVWGLEATVSHRKDTVTKAENAVHAKLRLAAATNGQDGQVVHMRWYDNDGSAEAYEGHGQITWAADGGGTADLKRVSITVTPSATNPALETIANPVNATPVPIIAELSPATGPEAGDTAVIIKGAYFTGASAVTFEGTTATEIQVHSDSLIFCKSPAGTGTADVLVTTSNGSNTNTSADDFVYTA